MIQADLLELLATVEDFSQLEVCIHFPCLVCMYGKGHVTY